MTTILLIVLLIILLGGGGGYYAHGRYGAPGVGGVLGLVLIVLIVPWLVGALSGAVGPTPYLRGCVSSPARALASPRRTAGRAQGPVELGTF